MTNADPTPAAVVYVRWFAVMCWLTVLGSIIYLITDYESVVSWVFATIMVLAVLPYLPLILVSRSKLGLGLYTLLSGFMLVSLFFTPAGAYLMLQVTNERMRGWFSGEPIASDVSIPTPVGYIALVTSTILGLLVCVAMGAGSAWLVGEHVLKPAEVDNAPLRDGSAKRAVHVPNGYELESKVHSIEPFPLTLSGQELGGKPYTFDPKRPNIFIIWATWCPDCLDQLEAVPNFHHTDTVLVTLDCESDGKDNRTAVRDKLRKARVPRSVDVICAEEAALPFKPEWIPTSVITDSDGDVRLIYSGTLRTMTAQRFIKRLNQSF